MPSVSLSLDPLRCSSVYRTGEQEEKPFFFFLSLFRVFFYSSVVGRVQSLFCLYPFFEPRVFFFSISAAWQINGSGKRRSPSGSWFIWSLCFSFRHHTFLYSPDVNNSALVAAHTKYCLQVGNGIAETTTSQSNLNRRVPAQSADGVPTKQNKTKTNWRVDDLLQKRMKLFGSVAAISSQPEIPWAGFSCIERAAKRRIDCASQFSSSRHLSSWPALKHANF